MGVLVFIGSLMRMRRRLGDRGDDRVLTPKPEANQAPDPSPDPPLIMEDDRQVRAAWEKALELAPQQRERILDARRNCAALLAMAETETLDLSLRDLAVMAKRNIPLLVAKVDALCAGAATGTERKALLHNLVQDLAQIGLAARREVEAHRERLKDDLAALRNHVSARTTEQDI